LALGAFEFGILVTRVESNTVLEVLKGIFGFEDGGVGNSATEVSLGDYTLMAAVEEGHKRSIP